MEVSSFRMFRMHTVEVVHEVHFHIFHCVDIRAYTGSFPLSGSQF
jgi:hypothetical protein